MGTVPCDVLWISLDIPRILDVKWRRIAGEKTLICIAAESESSCDSPEDKAN
jgi:hypothetical protein